MQPRAASSLKTSRIEASDAGIVESLDRWLRADVSWTIADEYPTVFGEASRARSVVVHDGDELVAHAACLDVVHRSRELDEVRHTLRLVGSVAVHPERRGEGLGRIVVEEVVRDFESSDAAGLILWSDKPEFYAKFGFAPWGCEFWVQPRAERPSDDVRPARPDDLDFLVATHNAKYRAVQRSAEDFARLLTIPRTQTWILERDTGPAAYACVGKGVDLEGVAHDCGGADEDLCELLSALPIMLAILPAERAQLALDIGSPACHTVGLALVKEQIDANLEGLDSI